MSNKLNPTEHLGRESVKENLSLYSYFTTRQILITSVKTEGLEIINSV